MIQSQLLHPVLRRCLEAERSRWLRRGAVWMLYGLLAVHATWPLARSPLSTIPIGTAPAATVPLFNLWTIWWNADRFTHGFQDYWNAPIFHPEKDTFAYSEPQPATLMVAPVLWWSGSRALAFNLYLWVSLVLNGVFAERLLRTLGAARPVAVCGALSLLMLPIAHWQLDVLQLVPLWGFLWTWDELVRACRQSSLKRAVLAGVALGVSFLICGHQGLLFAIPLAGSAWLLQTRWRSLKAWLVWPALLVAALAIMAPVAFKLRAVMQTNRFDRPRDLIAQLSALPGDYTAPTGRPVLDFGEAAARTHWHLSPGWLKTLLAAGGLAWGLSRRRWRRWTLFVTLTAALSFALSLGPNFKIGSWEPWWLLVDHVPGFAQVRNVFRFAFFVQMAVALLAAQCLQGLWLLIRKCRSSGRRRPSTARVLQTLVLLSGLAAVFETNPAPVKLAELPDIRAHRGWVDFLKQHVADDEAVACLPFAPLNTAEAFEQTGRWMYFGTYHGRRMVNGYSGFFPPSDFELRDFLVKHFLPEPILKRWIELKVRYLVALRAEVPVDRMQTLPLREVSVKLVYSDPAGIDLYELRARTSTGSE